MIKIFSIILIIVGMSASDGKPKKYPRKGIIYDFTGCTINYDINPKAIYCVA